MRMSHSGLFGTSYFNSDEDIKQENQHMWISTKPFTNEDNETKILNLELTIEHLASEITELKNLVQSLVNKDSTI